LDSIGALNILVLLLRRRYR